MSRVRPTALAFLSEARQLVDERAAFVAKPVSVPSELPPKLQRDNILQSFAEGKNPFGLLAFKLKAHKEVIEQIRVSGLPPARADVWRHVCTYVLFRDRVKSLSARWITLRGELSIPEDVHFSDERLSALDAIADTLQTALVDLPSTSKQLTERLAIALDSREEAMAILRHHAATAAFGDDLARHIASTRLSAVKEHIEVTCDQFAASTCRLSTNAVQVLHDIVGDPGINAQQLERGWSGLRVKLSQLRSLETAFQEITEACAAVARAGARDWSKRLLSEPVTGDGDPVVPSDWKAAWNWAAQTMRPRGQSSYS